MYIVRCKLTPNSRNGKMIFDIFWKNILDFAFLFALLSLFLVLDSEIGLANNEHGTGAQDDPQPVAHAQRGAVEYRRAALYQHNLTHKYHHGHSPEDFTVLHVVEGPLARRK